MKTSPCLFFVAEHIYAKKFCKVDYRVREQAPEEAEKGAYLPVKVKRQIRIVPDTPTEPFVYDLACYEFSRRDYKASYNAIEENGNIRMIFADKIDENVADSAEKCHRPVRIPAPEYLYRVVEHSARRKYKQIFGKGRFKQTFFQNYHLEDTFAIFAVP